MASDDPAPVFSELSAESGQPSSVESMCVNCMENGETKLLLTRIPHYREVILMSFECPSCGFKNNEVQPGGKIQDQGVEFHLRLTCERDLSRQVVKGDSASITFPEIDLEIPASSQKGAITTVEGLLNRTLEGLEHDQPVRRITDPEAAEQIDKFLAKVRDLLDVKEPCNMVLRDPSGNSFVESLVAPSKDPQLTVKAFTRSTEEDHTLGIYTQEELHEEKTAADDDVDRVAPDEVLHFPTNCPQCNAPAVTNMKLTSIPHFKEVVIMATTCDHCGHKTNEVKSGGGIEPRGTKITLKVTDPSDMSRDVLKSENCFLKLPDLDFEMGSFALGGRFTTLEGLLRNVLEQLENNPFLGTGSTEGDSSTDEQKRRLEEFKTKLGSLLQGNKEFLFILDDPTGNSYLQNVYAPDPDPEMKVEHYERTNEQNEALGINDMITEDYDCDEKTPLQKAHLLEVGAASTGKHLYSKHDENRQAAQGGVANKGLLTPTAIKDSHDASRRVSAAKSTTSSSDANGAGASGSSESGR